MERPVPDLMAFRKENLPKKWSERELHVPSWLLHVPSRLLQLIAKCLEKAPEDRFADGVALHETISENMVAESEEGAAVAIISLKSENEKLQGELQSYKQEQIAGKSIVKMPRALLAGLIILLLGSFTFGIFKSSPVKNSATPMAKDTIVRYKQKFVTDIATIKKIKLAVIDSIKKDSIKRAVAQKAALAHKKATQKKKKKKFLGIF